jgi:hypothetical protein
MLIASEQFWPRISSGIESWRTDLKSWGTGLVTITWLRQRLLTSATLQLLLTQTLLRIWLRITSGITFWIIELNSWDTLYKNAQSHMFYRFDN